MARSCLLPDYCSANSCLAPALAAKAANALAKMINASVKKRKRNNMIGLGGIFIALIIIGIFVAVIAYAVHEDNKDAEKKK